MLKIDYKYLVGIIGDSLRRKPTRLDWMGLTLASTEKGYINFSKDFDIYKFLASHTSQTLSIEHLLNSDLVSPSNQIFFTKGLWIDETYIYKSDEFFQLPQTYIYKASEVSDKTYIYKNSEFENDQVDFVVNMSSADTGLEDVVRYYVNLYKPGGKTYTIVYY